MAELVIKGDGIFASIPVIDVGDPPDYTQIDSVSVDVDWSGTMSDPVTIWQSGTAYIQSYHYVDSQGYNHYAIKYYPLSGWEWGTPTPPWVASEVTNFDKIYIASCVTGNRGFVWVSSEDNFPSQLYLYNGTKDNLIAQTEVDTSWDETPSEDENNPFNENAIGGEYADRGDFDETFLQDLLPDPEDMEPVNTGGVVCCYSLDHSHMVLLNQCLFIADFWTTLSNRFSGLSDPLSMILQCVELPLVPSRGNVLVAKIGGIEIMTPPEDGSSHSISLPSPATRYGRYYIGNLINKEVWGSEKDYSATSVSIYLPYVGVKELDVDIVMDNVLELYLYVDYWTGDILYLLRVSNSIRPAKYYTQTSVIYRWTGNCAREVPLGRIDNTGPILHAASAIGSAFAGFIGGASVSTVAASSGLDIEADTTQIQTGSPNVPKNLNGFINGFTPTIQTSGNIAGNVGSMDYQYPY